MTDNEADNILAGWVRERRDLRLTIRCLEEKLRQSKAGFNAAIQMIDAVGKVTSPQISFPQLAYLPENELRSTIDDMSAAQVRLTEIEAALNE